MTNSCSKPDTDHLQHTIFNELLFFRDLDICHLYVIQTKVLSSKLKFYLI